MSRRGSRATSGCPCGSGASYSRCCGPLHLRTRQADTAEQLMRSRYSAFAKGLDDYLRYSWSPRTCPADLVVGDPRRWTGLEVVRVESGGIDDQDGIVEFVASYRHGGRDAALNEVSRFERLDGRWVYSGPR